jgi:hypothetical protein
MPLRCIGPDGQSIQSFNLPEAEWSALRLENRRLRHLRMPCCEAFVVMKTSNGGLKFLAHKSRGPCQRPIDNERKACDAVARALGHLSGHLRTNGYSPEDFGGSAQVEYFFDLGGTRHAVEHMIVEAFAGQIHTGIDFEPFIAPIVAALDHHMQPPGRFESSGICAARD